MKILTHRPCVIKQLNALYIYEIVKYFCSNKVFPIIPKALKIALGDSLEHKDYLQEYYLELILFGEANTVTLFISFYQKCTFTIHPNYYVEFNLVSS